MGTPPTSTMTPATELCAIDSRGDLWLTTQGIPTKLFTISARTKFRVCSRTLARSSPVFDKMLFGSFAESKPKDDGEWAVSLPEDTTAAMKPLLELMHGNFSSFQPGHAHNSRLYHLLVAADKYDCIHLLRPFAAHWVEALYAITSYQDDHYWLAWIFYQLGCETGYRQVATRLVVDFIDDASLFRPRILPPGFQGKFKQLYHTREHARSTDGGY